MSILFFGSNVTGLINAVIHNTKNTLNIFDHMIFPTAILALDLVTATTDVTSSGSDVPIASIVTPISFSLHHRIVASVTALFTTKFPPKVSHAIPAATKVSDFT